MLGGKGADATSKIPSPGGLGSLLSGGLGGLAGGGLLGALTNSGGLDVAQMAGSLVGGGVLGTIVTAVVGLVVKGQKK